MHLRILSLNVWALPWPVGRDVGPRMRAISDALPRLDPDLVCLQEVWREDARQQLLEAGRRHGYRHRWWPPGAAGSGSGLLVLSRLALESVRFERYHLRGLPQRIHHGDYHGHKGFVLLRVATQNGPVAVANTHLHAQYLADGSDEYLGIRVGQVVQLAAALAAVEEPLVAAGDFNLREGRPEYAILTGLASLRDTAAELDRRQYTSRRANPYHADRPSPDSRIDYVFARDGLRRGVRPLRVERVLDREIELAGRRGAYSDHDGLLAELEIGPSVRTPAGRARRPVQARAAVRQAASLLAAGRASALRRRRGERAAAGASVLATGLTLAGSRRVSRRRWLRGALGLSPLVLLPAGAGFAWLSEGAVPAELAAYRRVEALLAGFR